MKEVFANQKPLEEEDLRRISEVGVILDLNAEDLASGSGRNW
jgi:hypothetical protein